MYIYPVYMKREKRVKAGRRGSKPRELALNAAAEKGSSERAKRNYRAWPDLEGLYRPVKKPVTLRLDADVLAWFKKDGRHYQTRINRALREVMERDMKGSGGLKGKHEETH